MNSPPKDSGTAACPFCGSHNISDGESLSSDADGANLCTQSECLDCGAVGPKAPLLPNEVDYGSVKAIAAWNRRAAPPLEGEGGWQPIETAPRDGKRILFYSTGHGGGYGVGMWAKHDHVPIYGWVVPVPGEWEVRGCEPTHWMHLPAPPEDGASASSSLHLDPDS